MVLVKSLRLQTCCDRLSIRAATTGPFGHHLAAATELTGYMSSRHLENGEEGVALVLVQSSKVNITLASDNTLVSPRFELQVFPYYRTRQHTHSLNSSQLSLSLSLSPNSQVEH